MEKGKLYVVSTPIGNFDDFSFRGRDILGKVDYVACEDTRVTGLLLSHFSINKKMIVYQEHNKEKSAKNIIKLIEEGSEIALVTDAGTPCISDPGYYVVKELRDKDISVIPIPGPSAFISALSVSGFATDRFLFEGFLNGSKKKKKDKIKELIDSEITFILYESPYRIIGLIETIKEVCDDVQIFIAREMTKKYEEHYRGSAKEVLDKLTNSIIKGEFVVIVDKYSKREHNLEEINDDYIYKTYLNKYNILKNKKKAMKETAKELGVGKNRIYQVVLDRK